MTSTRQTAVEVATLTLLEVIEKGREEGWHEELEDRILDVLDQLAGFCNPLLRLVSAKEAA